MLPDSHIAHTLSLAPILHGGESGVRGRRRSAHILRTVAPSGNTPHPALSPQERGEGSLGGWREV